MYAVLSGDAHLDLGSIGIPDGLTRVVSVEAGGITAAVSEYQGAAIRDLPQVQRLGHLLVHQQVLEQLLERAADRELLPIKFGTVLSGEDEVRALLTRYRAPLLAALQDVGGAVEVDLSATWDVPSVLQAAASEPALAELRATLQSPEDATSRSSEDDTEMRVRAGKLAYETLERKREEYRRHVVEQLVPLVRDAEPNPIPSDDVVLNVAFLVDRAQISQFDDLVERLGAELEDRLSFRYVGPLPPYSFATVQISRPDPSEIEAARELLALGDIVTKEELRGRYRELAAQAHPDRNQHDMQSQARFQEFVSAYNALDRYTRGQDAGGDDTGRESRFDLRPNAVASALLLEIRRADMAGPLDA
jgi:hypothetical protein